jgi:hypothetical protein
MTLGRVRRCESSLLSAASTFHRAREAMLCERTYPRARYSGPYSSTFGVKVFLEGRALYDAPTLWGGEK